MTADLHPRLLAKLDDLDRAVDEAPWAAGPLAALRAVVARHLLCPVSACPDIRTIAEALGLTEGNDHRG